MTIQPDERENCTSASSAEADLNCPGRFQAQKGCAPETSADAESGIRIHAALADSQSRALMESLTADERDIFDSCREIEKSLCNKFFGEGEKLKVFREQRYWCRIQTPSGLIRHSGKGDVTYRNATKALILDYKTGRGEVAESSSNLQLRDSAVLVSSNLLVWEIGAAVVQPLVSMNPEICLYDKEALSKASRMMMDRVRKSNNPAAPRVAGEIQCRYCLAKSKCLEHTRWMGSLLPAPITMASVPMAAWTPEQCAIFCEGMSSAQKWLNDAKDMVKQRLKENPDSIPGWTISEGDSMTVIINPQEAFNRMSTLGCTIDQFMGCVKVGKGELEKRIRALTSTKGKGLKAEVDKILEGLVTVTKKEGSIERKA